MRWPGWLRRMLAPAPAPRDEISRARELIRAIDRGGVPLNPAKINALARELGMEVSRNAPVEHTIERIRAWLERDAGR